MSYIAQVLRKYDVLIILVAKNEIQIKKCALTLAIFTNLKASHPVAFESSMGKKIFAKSFRQCSVSQWFNGGWINKKNCVIDNFRIFFATPHSSCFNTFAHIFANMRMFSDLKLKEII